MQLVDNSFDDAYHIITESDEQLCSSVSGITDFLWELGFDSNINPGDIWRLASPPTFLIPVAGTLLFPQEDDVTSP